MVKEEDFVRMDVSEAVHKIAYRFAYTDSKNYNKFTLRKDNGGRFVGFIGELMTIKFLKQNGINYDWKNRDPKSVSYNYDVNVNDLRLEIKTKDRRFDPKLFYDCSVAAYQRQMCDFYIFTTLTRDNTLEYPYPRITMLGYLPKTDYMDMARFMKKGDIDPSNGWPVSMDCYNVAIKDLEPISKLTKIISPQFPQIS